jgi:hypothetical protein
MQRIRIVILAILFLAPSVSRGGDILNEVPSDAVGFVLIHNLSTIDAKVGQLATLLQRNVPRPLTFLKDVTGIGEGLNVDGDCMLALFLTPDGGDEGLQFCVWLPVADYDRFIKSIGATSIDGVAAATIAGEDLLIAHRGDWALIMDPDQRDRIAELTAANSSQSPIAAWRQWINSNDVTIAFSPSVHNVLKWAAIRNDEEQKPGTVDENPFGARNGNANRQAIAANSFRTTPDLVESARTAFQKWCAVMPELSDAIAQANMVACGIRLDANTNVLASLRITLPKEMTKSLIEDGSKKPVESPFTTYEGGGFVLSGVGHVPASALTKLAIAYAQLTADELNDSEGTTQFDDATLKRLEESIGKAAAEVRSVTVLSQPGEEAQPVYTNEFLTLRVASAATFVTHANEVMRLWNKANRDAKGEMLFVFDVEEVKLGERTATQYSLDMAGLAGGVILPEVRQSMERLFGPGGKLRFWVVPADETTVLLASATPDQITKALKAFDRKQHIEWKGDQLSESSALLPAESDWRIFVNLHRYFEWAGREASAVVGVPVIGGPLVKSFPTSPPIGIAGGFREGEVWLEAVALGPTVKSVDTYLTRGRSRTPFQMRARVVPGAPAPQPNR